MGYGEGGLLDSLLKSFWTHTHIPKGCYMDNVTFCIIHHLNITIKNDKPIEMISIS